MRKYVKLVICLVTLLGWSLVATVDKAKVCAATTTTSIPNEKKHRAIQVLLDYLNQSSDEQCLAGFPDMKQQTKIDLNDCVAFRTANGVPKVLLVDVGLGYSPYFDLHLIFWKANKVWQYQEIPAFPNTFQSMQARVSVSQFGVPEVGAFYDSSRGSGSPVPVFALLQLQHQQWQIAWRTPNLSSNMDHGDAWFIGNGISRFALEYDSWLSKDPRKHIFSECHPCLHRRYRYVWRREGNTKYVLESFGPIDSPYNTLTDFIYFVSIGRTDEAAQYVKDPVLVHKALALGLRKEPNTPGWFINGANRDRGPYRITSGPASGTEITFSLRHNRVLISDLQQG